MPKRRSHPPTGLCPLCEVQADLKLARWIAETVKSSHTARADISAACLLLSIPPPEDGPDYYHDLRAAWIEATKPE